MSVAAHQSPAQRLAGRASPAPGGRASGPDLSGASQVVGLPAMVDLTAAASAEPAVLTLAEAASKLRISLEHARKLATRGELPGAFRLGRRHLVSNEALHRFLATAGESESA
jgi:excisionase family DNA binding protein